MKIVTMERLLCLLLCLPLQAPAKPESPPVLRLLEAEQIALKTDPEIAAAQSRVSALQYDAIADAQLPDPKLRTGLYNVPLDDFALDRQPTTQLRLGVVQAFPRGDTLAFKSGQRLASAAAEKARVDLAMANALLSVRKSYLQIYYQQQAQKIILASRQLFESLVDVTRVQYGTGSGNQQDVLRAELELSRLDDRLNRLQNMEDNARAELSRWIGTAAQGLISNELPELPDLPDSPLLEKAMGRHPVIRVKSAQIEVHEKAINIAREQYKPGWSLGVEYRKRFGENPDGSDREDMAAVMLSVDLPLFPKNRQDKRVAASLARADAAYYDRDSTMRGLQRKLETETANLQRLKERVSRYRERLLKESRANAEAALLSYQSGASPFTGLMRARITELEIRLQALKLQTDLLASKAELLYLATGVEQ